jgi:16S rRNA processing protein RimM
MRKWNVRVARIGRPHGIRGEVTVEVFTDSPETRFAEGNALQLHTTRESPVFELLTVQKARWNKNILLLKFAEVNDRDAAESLRDSELYAPAEDTLRKFEGWYAVDLIGLDVYQESVEAAKIGEVTGLTTGAAQDLLQVSLSDGREVLVPFVHDIVPEINQEKGFVVITPPPGLLELNQE